MHHDQAMKIVTEAIKKWVDCFNSGDAKGVAHCYAEHAIYSNSMLGVLKGRDKIEKGIAHLIAVRGKMSVECTELSYLNDDNFVGAGHYSISGPDGSTMRGNFGCTMVKHRDEWGMTLHVANIAPPA